MITCPKLDKVADANPGRITHLYVFVATRADGKEGLICSQFDGEIHPFIAADQARLDALMPLAREFAARRPDVLVHLTEFTRTGDKLAIT